MISITACNRGKTQPPAGGDGVSLDQSVTTDAKPKDVIFVDFQNNWKKFISQRPEIALPVVPISANQPKVAWEPLVLSQCVFSPDAGGYVAQMTLVWTEPVPETPVPGILLTRQVQQSPQPNEEVKKEEPKKEEPSRIRFDLAVHFQGFEKNRFTAALASDKLTRFNLPPSSDLIVNSDALLLTGPSIFPKVMDFRTEMVTDQVTKREIPKNTLVMRDFGPGLTYKLRMSTLGVNQWNESKQFAFSTPVCPKEF